ncbi:MAG: hypothetical protein CL550_01450 [Alcanivorax sp.]|nr:hypothetical protein [Alcanivorax sp.]
MPLNRPHARELQQAIEHYRQRPDPDPRVDEYYGKVIAHLEALLEREKALAAAFAHQEKEAMEQLAAVLKSSDQTLSGLCRRLASGNVNEHLPAVLETLLAVAEAKLDIDSPRYPRAN